MTNQERSAAQEAALSYRHAVGYCFPNPTENEIAVMHAVLTKHEADVRRRIANKIGAITCYNLQSEDLQRRILAIVNPPEPPKPVLCKTEWCRRPIIYMHGIANPRWVHLETNSEDCAFGYKAEPAEESTR